MVQLTHPWNNKLVPNRKRSTSGCILSPCLFNLYAEHITRNTGLEEAQAGIKIAGRNIYNLRYGNDIKLIAESKEELKGLLMKVKWESEKAGLKLNVHRCMDVRVGPSRRLSAKELMLLKCSVGEESWESLGLQEDQTSPF